MPIFEYKCKKCGRISEILVRNDEDKPVCENCGSKKLEKLFSAFAMSGTKKKGHKKNCSCCSKTGSACRTC